MRFPFEVVRSSKQKVNERIYIKFVDNMDLKFETDVLDGNISKS
jgi:hypothetical protein